MDRHATLYDRLIELRDQQRKHRAGAPIVLKGKDLPWEDNPQGRMRWYLHPALENVPAQTLIFYVQQLAPGGRSGRQHCGGNQVFFILEGKGHTSINGVRYDWKTGDTVTLPLFRDGVTYQHFNDDVEHEARFISCQANTVHSLGVDGGCGFEQLENAP